MTADQATPTHDTRTATMLFGFALTVLAATLGALAIWGLPALAMIGLAATLAVFAMLIAYAAGL